MSSRVSFAGPGPEAMNFALGAVMSLKLQLPKLVDVKPRLTVIGVGGAGCNAVNNMIAAGLQGVDFVVANTDAQCLAASSAEHRIQLGAHLTEGLGAGSRPEIGEAAAEEALEEIRSHIVGSHMVFIAAGMGGGTGTGAAAVIARASKELGILTVGIVTKPFQFEGARRLRIAETGVQMLRQNVDTLIVIPNQNLFRIANERTTFSEAFVLADQVLYSGVACIVDLVLKEGLINLDFADVKTVMTGMGTAMMGTGEASGDRRAILAAEEAIANPLLDDVSLRGARGLLLSITGGRDLTLYEVDEAASRVREEVDPDCNIIVGATFDENLGERVRVSIVASGMKRVGEPAQPVVQVVPAQQMPKSGLPHQVELSRASPQAKPAAAYPPQNNPQYGGPHALHTQQSGGHNPNEDMQRRLSEALQHVSPPPPAAVARPAATGYPHNLQAEPPRDMRNGWAGPNNVMIEDGYTPLGQQIPHPAQMPNYASMPIQQTHSAPAAPPQRHFEPQPPPAEIRRTVQRRLPEVEDLPVVGQREWNARQGTNAPHGPAEEQKRKSFFGRLTNLGRRTHEASLETNQSGMNTEDDDAPLPVFFGRERR